MISLSSLRGIGGRFARPIGVLMHQSTLPGAAPSGQHVRDAMNVLRRRTDGIDRLVVAVKESAHEAKLDSHVEGAVVGRLLAGLEQNDHRASVSGQGPFACGLPVAQARGLARGCLRALGVPEDSGIAFDAEFVKRVEGDPHAIA